MTQPPETPRDDAVLYPPSVPPEPPTAWVPPSLPATPAPPAWEPPAPLSFGPPEPPTGPLVSPAVAAYQPPPPFVESNEPPTGVIGMPVTGPPGSVPPAPYPPPYGPPVSAAPTSGYPPPYGPPVSAAPTSGYPPPSYPVPSAPPPASYYPPPMPPTYYPPTGYGGYAPGYPATMPMAYAFDPATGQPYSEKSKTTAGLLQLLLGFFLGLGGIGRLYAGNTGLGIAQLLLSVLAWLSLCAAYLIFPILFWLGVWLWSWIDGIVMLAGRPVDAQGRALRP